MSVSFSSALSDSVKSSIRVAQKSKKIFLVAKIYGIDLPERLPLTGCAVRHDK